MEKKYIYYPFMVLAMTVALSSCDDFLDEMPDNRTELDTEAQITSMLVSAYPETNYALLAEMSFQHETLYPIRMDETKRYTIL